MAIITSAQTGNWEDTTTWVGGVVPSNLDEIIIEIGHTVTINSSIAINNTGVLHQKGTLIIADNSVLTLGLASPRTYGTIYIYGGSVTKSTGNGYMTLHMGTFQSKETSATNRAKFTCMVKHASSYFNYYIDLSYVDVFGNDEQTTGMCFTFKWKTDKWYTGTGFFPVSGSKDNTLILKNCTFSNMKGERTTTGERVNYNFAFRLGVGGSTGQGKFTVDIQNCDFKNVDGFYITADDVSGKPWIFKNNTCSATNTDDGLYNCFMNNSLANFTVPIETSNNVFANVLASGVIGSSINVWNTTMTNSQVLFSSTNDLDISDDPKTTFANTNENSSLTNTYMLRTDKADNPHIIGVENLLDCIIQHEKEDETNYVMSANNVQNCITMGSGDLFNLVGYYDGNSFAVKNNTFIDRFGYVVTAMFLVENSTVANTSITLKNNLLYSAVRDTTFPFEFARWVGTPESEQVPLDMAYNISYPAPKEWLAEEFINSSSAPDTNVVINPQMVDPTRDLRRATVEFLGYTGDITSTEIATPYLLSNGFDDSGEYPTQSIDKATHYMDSFTQVTDWIKEGVTPTNMSLATAGESGTYVGAVEPKQVVVESADLTLSANKTNITLGETITFTLELSQALSTDTTVVLTVDGTDRDCVILAGSTEDTTTHKPSAKGTKLISIKSTDNENVNIVSPSSVSVVVEEDTPEPPSENGGIFWKCSDGVVRKITNINYL